MTDQKDYMFGAVVGWTAAVIMSVAAVIAIVQRDGWQKSYTDLKAQAIAQHYAQYNPTNGVWEWLPPGK